MDITVAAVANKLTTNCLLNHNNVEDTQQPICPQIVHVHNHFYMNEKLETG